jgi:hypothetical protein
MTKASIRRQLQGLRERLSPPQPAIIAATIDVRSNQIRSILMADSGNRPAPADLTVEDLPGTCRVFQYDPSRECLLMYQSTHDGLAYAQRVLSVDEDIVTGRAPCWDAPMNAWEKLFAGQHDGGDCRASD